MSCVERRGHELGLPGSRAAYIQTDVAINQVGRGAREAGEGAIEEVGRGKQEAGDGVVEEVG